MDLLKSINTLVEAKDTKEPKWLVDRRKTDPEWVDARLRTIAQYEEMIRKMEDAEGWTPGGTYNRDWKKDVNRHKKFLKLLKAGKGNTAGGQDLHEAKDEDIDNEQLTDADLEDADEEDPTEDVGSVSKSQGFEKSKSEMYAFGKTRPVTLLTKDETLGGLSLTLQYVINPATGAWKFRACLAGQSEEDMVEFDTGEDPSSLIKSLKKKTKITPHQAVEYLHPPANKKVEKSDDAVEESLAE